MSFAAATTRGIAPQSLNLDGLQRNAGFGAPSVDQWAQTQQQHHTLQNTGFSGGASVAGHARPQTPLTQLSDEEDDIFNLDMVTMDMDFEQAYLMYTQLQQKNAELGAEQLQRVQQTRLQNTKGPFARPYGNAPETRHLSLPSDPAYGAGSLHPGSHAHAPLLQHNLQRVARNHINAFLPNVLLISPPGEMLDEFGGLFATPTNVATQAAPEEGDQFFSNLESNALEKFLDNLAFSSQTNPLEFYRQNSPRNASMYEMGAMAMNQLHAVKAEDIKRDITDAFKHPPSQSLKFFSGENRGPMMQLATPSTPEKERKRSAKVEEDEDSDDEGSLSPSGQKRRRKTGKPLLSLEQKRLNHSHSEQKRRMLCKEAYERCLRLITNVDDYKNDLVSACTMTSSKKKSKRRQINKDGLPNLLKHSALLKISGEILKIQEKNERLRKLVQLY